MAIKTERKDKKKRLWKVTKELLKNPLLTTREIEKKTWISKSTVANYINNDLDKVGLKDDRILWICDKDLEIVNWTQAEIARRIRDEKEEVTMSDLIKAWDVSAKRYSLFKWDITDNEGWMKNITNIEIL